MHTPHPDVHSYYDGGYVAVRPVVWQWTASGWQAAYVGPWFYGPAASHRSPWYWVNQSTGAVESPREGLGANPHYAFAMTIDFYWYETGESHRHDVGGMNHGTWCSFPH